MNQLNVFESTWCFPVPHSNFDILHCIMRLFVAMTNRVYDQVIVYADENIRESYEIDLIN